METHHTKEMPSPLSRRIDQSRESLDRTLKLKELPQELTHQLSSCRNGDDFKRVVRTFCMEKGIAFHPDSIFESQATMNWEQMRDVLFQQGILWQAELPSEDGGKESIQMQYALSGTSDGKGIIAFWKKESDPQWYPFEALAQSYDHQPAPWNGREWIMSEN